MPLCRPRCCMSGTLTITPRPAFGAETAVRPNRRTRRAWKRLTGVWLPGVVVVGVLAAASAPAHAAEDSFFDGTFDVSNLDGSNGFRIAGIDEFDRLGTSVASAGDVNGDGFNDLIIGAPGGDPTGTYFATIESGESYVIFGGTSVGSTGSVNPPLARNDAPPSNRGFSIAGANFYDRSGSSVASAGDVNGDGFADVIIGAYHAYGNVGESYVVFGKSTAPSDGTGTKVNLEALDGTNGFRLRGVNANDASGFSVASAGDVNKDGFDDILIGAPGFSNSPGKSYVVFGGASVSSTGSIPLSSLDGTNGFRLDGVSGSITGFSGAPAGDVNNDGIADFIVGAIGANGGGGASYVVYGSTSLGTPGSAASVDLTSLDGTNGFAINGTGQSGFSVASAGDVNGDGFDDLIIGANAANANDNAGNPTVGGAGVSYVVFGTQNGPIGSIDLADIDGTNGFRLEGTYAGGRSGGSVASAGDVNGDGFADLIVGAIFAGSFDPIYSNGEAYVVFGGASVGSSGSIFLKAGTAADELNGTTGFRLRGLGLYDSFGLSVSSAGDINGDGIDDLIIAAPHAGYYGKREFGESYVIFGQAIPEPSTGLLAALLAPLALLRRRRASIKRGPTG